MRLHRDDTNTDWTIYVILVVEDEAGIADLVVEALSQANHEARVAATASDAVNMLMAQRPDLILLDINLPDASGTSTLDRLRRVQPDVPIIMLTANADEELARDTLKRGAFDYVTKPFNLDHSSGSSRSRWRHTDVGVNSLLPARNVRRASVAVKGAGAQRPPTP